MDTQVADLLGGEQVLGKSIRTNLDLAHATRRGLPAESAVRLAVFISHAVEDRQGPLDALVAKLQSVSEKDSSLLLTPAESDIVIRTANTFAKAIDVLGDREKAAHWLKTPNRALGGESPIALLDTSAGAHEVEALLDRIEFGVYS